MHHLAATACLLAALALLGADGVLVKKIHRGRQQPITAASRYESESIKASGGLGDCRPYHHGACDRRVAWRNCPMVEKLRVHQTTPRLPASSSTPLPSSSHHSSVVRADPARAFARVEGSYLGRDELDGLAEDLQGWLAHWLRRRAAADPG